MADGEVGSVTWVNDVIIFGIVISVILSGCTFTAILLRETAKARREVARLRQTLRAEIRRLDRRIDDVEGDNYDRDARVVRKRVIRDVSPIVELGQSEGEYLNPRSLRVVQALKTGDGESEECCDREGDVGRRDMVEAVRSESMVEERKERRACEGCMDMGALRVLVRSSGSGDDREDWSCGGEKIGTWQESREEERSYMTDWREGSSEDVEIISLGFPKLEGEDEEEGLTSTEMICDSVV